jgi:single-strand DNA-binding protein
MPKYGINKATLLGNVGSEPELKYLDQGVAVCTFRLATTERVKGRDGQQIDRTDWHNIVLWRQKAEIAHKVLRVGSGVYLEGRIVTRSWDGPDGQKRYKTEVEADTLRLLDAVPDTAPTPPAAQAQTPASQTQTPVVKPASPAQPADSNPSTETHGDDDLPF